MNRRPDLYEPTIAEGIMALARGGFTDKEISRIYKASRKTIRRVIQKNTTDGLPPKVWRNQYGRGLYGN